MSIITDFNAKSIGEFFYVQLKKASKLVQLGLCLLANASMTGDIYTLSNHWIIKQSQLPNIRQ